jgi:hypothetical protein
MAMAERIDLGGGIFMEPVDPQPTRFHKRIVETERIPNTQSGNYLVLECGHRKMAFGDLSRAKNGMVLCDTCRDSGQVNKSQPNLQNIPIRTELGRGIRKKFTEGKTMDTSKIPCVKLTRPDLDNGRTSCILEMHQFSASDEFAGAEIGEKLQLEYIEMTREEIDALPEFGGW